MRPLALAVTLVLSPFLLAQQRSSDLVVTLAPFQKPEQGTAVTLQATLRNRTSMAISGVDVDVALTGARSTVTAAPHAAWPKDQWTCSPLTPQHVRCRVDISEGPGQFIPLMITIDPVVEGRFTLEAHATWTAGGTQFTSEPAIERLLLERAIVVTSAEDAGPGTLREAVDRLNGECTADGVPCSVHFDLPPAPGRDYASIGLRSALPPITASDFSIDGEDVVELDGSHVAVGEGLDVRGEGPATVRNLSIGGFPQNGIRLSRRDGSFIYRCLLGVRPDLSPNPNGNRGITVHAPASNVMLSNGISAANGRSGVFIDGATDVTLLSMVIGDVGGAGLGNGASGVYVGPGSRKIELLYNIIETNAHFGIAVAEGAEGVRLLTTNRIVGNRILNLDHGLDGFSGHGIHGLRTPAPRITTVEYDAERDLTTIAGTLEIPDPDKQWTVTLYPSAYVYTDLPLHTTSVHDGQWSFTFSGSPLRRVDASAYADSSDPAYSTSELAEPVTVP